MVIDLQIGLFNHNVEDKLLQMQAGEAHLHLHTDEFTIFKTEIFKCHPNTIPIHSRSTVNLGPRVRCSQANVSKEAVSGIV